MSENEKIGLKLIANNEKDFKVISAYLQDSIVTIRDIVFLKKNKTFIMIVNRFMWEDVEKGIFRDNKRIRCAIKFETVLQVKKRNINQKNKNKPLECLALETLFTKEKNYYTSIFFAGDGIITIISEVIDVSLKDIGEQWKVKSSPVHKI